MPHHKPLGGQALHLAAPDLAARRVCVDSTTAVHASRRSDTARHLRGALAFTALATKDTTCGERRARERSS